MGVRESKELITGSGGIVGRIPNPTFALEPDFAPNPGEASR
jgi:hypothetical protein